MIKVGIIGYGNLGRGVEYALHHSKDMELVGVFSRRPKESVTTVFNETTVYSMKELYDFKDTIDTLILCGGSKSDLPEQSPTLAKHFHIVDSFDTHAKIPEHFKAIDEATKQNQTVAILSAGWDPGLFSIQRIMMDAILPKGTTHTFWGKGLSQGHSDAVRRVEGVQSAVQYTIPSEEAMEAVKNGEGEQLTTKDKHKRQVYVVSDGTRSEQEIREEIQNMPDYFEPFDTTVYFINEDEMQTEHQKMPHGGFVIHSGQTGESTQQTMEFSLKLDSNPEFTASVLVAYARACAKMAQEGQTGAKTVFDIAPKYLSPESNEWLRKTQL